jgi:putative mRNA 3-end processing factor
MTFPIDVMGSGGVLLGANVVCDGFHRERPFRVQTHVHDDHMANFDTSKGFQSLLMSEETYSLLAAEFDADLLVRENNARYPYGARCDIGCGRVTLLPSGHMLGAVQVQIETESGLRLGYSGDFQWPLEQAIEVDALVVDSTYGSPDSIRRYTQEEAEDQLLSLLFARLKHGSVHIKAHRGTVQRAVRILSGEVDAPIICSRRLAAEIEVYQRFGAAVGSVLCMGTPDAKAAVSSGRYVRLYSKGDRCPDQLPEGTMVVLSAFMARPDDPVLEYSDRAYRVALSNHADFLGTLEYVRATGARYVVADNTRGKGVELAQAIRERLGVEAVPSTNMHSNEWGL